MKDILIYTCLGHKDACRNQTYKGVVRKSKVLLKDIIIYTGLGHKEA